MDLVAKFKQSLTAQLAPHGVALSIWRGGTRSSNHLLELATSPTSTVLYVKYSAKVPGFWGLTANQLDHIVSANVRWFCVFLHQSSSSGYVLPGIQVQACINDGSFELAEAGDYKVHEQSDFSASQHFDNIEAVTSRILRGG
ncbi:MAG TPA: hypothetical protein VIE67_05695 [Rudaea sp.]|jgi:hypothetical protein|uniref:hypothetical protein n=1 Tax=Rudaea sp. TaxID=2136325 RepID=UPI002F95891F